MWCPRTDSNRGPIDYKSIALPAELQGLWTIFYNIIKKNSIFYLYLIFLFNLIFINKYEQR